MSKKLRQIDELVGAISKLDEDTFKERDLFQKKAALTIKEIFGENNQHLDDWRKIEIPIAPPFSGNFDLFFAYKDELNIVKQKMANICQVMKEDLERSEQSKSAKAQEPEELIEETKKALVLFDAIITHPKINEVSSVHFKNGNYRSAVLDAAIKLEVMVKEKANYPKNNTGTELSGARLMHFVFDSNNPILSWCKDTRQVDKDELEGYKLIFAGTVLGIRDPKAHAIFEIKPMRALKLLTLITLLAELVDASNYVKQDPQLLG
jgi:uncharacterized protein (TIGR02391 family)